MITFPPKYPAKFKPDEIATVVIGGYKGKPVTVREVLDGWPYANYRVEHETDGFMNLNERELGKIKHARASAGTTGSDSAAGSEAGVPAREA